MSMEKRLKAVRAGELMTRFAVTATPDQTIVEVAMLLMRFKISGVPVVDDEEALIGIVTASDLFGVMEGIIADVEKGRDPRERSCQLVGGVMTRAVTCVTPETSLYDLIGLMNDQNIHTLPVVVDGKIEGVVGRRDVINACYLTVGSHYFHSER